MMQKQERRKHPKPLHWLTGWKCLAEALTLTLFAISSTSGIWNTELPLYTRIFEALGSIFLWLFVLGWIYDGVKISRKGPFLSKFDGFLSNKPWVHLIASLILLAASLWMTNSLRDGGYIPSALPVLLQLLIYWLINIFCWLHVAALRKLGQPTVAPTTERWWIEGESL
jgi:hypothetical protein